MNAEWIQDLKMYSPLFVISSSCCTRKCGRCVAQVQFGISIGNNNSLQHTGVLLCVCNTVNFRCLFYYFIPLYFPLYLWLLKQNTWECYSDMESSCESCFPSVGTVLQRAPLWAAMKGMNKGLIRPFQLEDLLHLIDAPFAASFVSS